MLRKPNFNVPPSRSITIRNRELVAASDVLMTHPVFLETEKCCGHDLYALGFFFAAVRRFREVYGREFICLDELANYTPPPLEEWPPCPTLDRTSSR